MPHLGTARCVVGVRLGWVSDHGHFLRDRDRDPSFGLVRPSGFPPSGSPLGQGSPGDTLSIVPKIFSKISGNLAAFLITLAVVFPTIL
jgi:hypothetical protein